MSEELGEKQHPATPRRRQLAREQGRVAKSHDLSAAALLLAGLGILLAAGTGLAEYFHHLGTARWGETPLLSLDVDTAVDACRAALTDLTGPLLPVLVGALLAAIVTQLVQTGFLFLPGRAAPDTSRISPAAGLARIFSAEGLSRILFGLLKLLAIAAVIWFSLVPRVGEIARLAELSAGACAAYLIDLLLTAGLQLAGALIVVGLLEYGYQRWKHERGLRMTSRELKDEMRQQEGGPELAGRRRAARQQLAAQAAAREVPKADVVLLAGQLAVALRYDPERLEAPEVVARGRGTSARQIRLTAQQHGVPTLQRRALAGGLYGAAEAGTHVPPRFYGEVAEALREAEALRGI